MAAERNGHSVVSEGISVATVYQGKRKLHAVPLPKDATLSLFQKVFADGFCICC